MYTLFSKIVPSKLTSHTRGSDTALLQLSSVNLIPYSLSLPPLQLCTVTLFPNKSSRQLPHLCSRGILG